jgi:hypothetical protein
MQLNNVTVYKESLSHADVLLTELIDASLMKQAEQFP